MCVVTTEIHDATGLILGEIVQSELAGAFWRTLTVIDAQGASVQIVIHAKSREALLLPVDANAQPMAAE